MAVEREGRRKGRRATFPDELVEEVEKLPPDERRRRLIDYIDRHGEDIPPGGGYGPEVLTPSGDREPSE